MHAALALIVAISPIGIDGSTAAAAEGSAPTRTLSAKQLVDEVRFKGSVAGPAVIEGDVDLSLLEPPKSRSSGPVTFTEVTFRGWLSGTPRHPLLITGGSVCAIAAGAKGGEWPYGITLQNVGVAHLLFGHQRVNGDFTCLGCSVCNAAFEETHFRDDATFTGTHFSVPVPDACVRPVLAPCMAADFSETTFETIARFDHANFAAGASFHGAEFRGGARFPSVTSALPIDFIGARIRGDAEFRGCQLEGGIVFGYERPTTYEATAFASMADFRGCTFNGPVRFDDTAFLGETRLARVDARSATVSFRGVLASHPIDLRGMTLTGDTSRVLLDAPAAEAVRLDWSKLRTAILRGAQADERAAAMLQALASRLETDGALRAAREVRFEAELESRAVRPCGDSWGACAASEAEWWLWKRPTRNGIDPTFVLAAIALLWSTSVIVVVQRGRAVVLPRIKKDEAPPIYEPYRPTSPAASPPGSHCPVGVGRVIEALRFATALVLKLGSPRVRSVAPASPTRAAILGVALKGVWLLAWVLLAAFVGVVATSFPGLVFLRPGA